MEVMLNGNCTQMEVDTGASVSLISEESFKAIRESGAALRPSNVKLSTCMGEPIEILDVTDVKVEYNAQSYHLSLFAVIVHRC